MTALDGDNEGEERRKVLLYAYLFNDPMSLARAI